MCWPKRNVLFWKVILISKKPRFLLLDPFADAAKGDEEGVQVIFHLSFFMTHDRKSVGLFNLNLSTGWSSPHSNSTTQRPQNVDHHSGSLQGIWFEEDRPGLQKGEAFIQWKIWPWPCLWCAWVALLMQLMCAHPLKVHLILGVCLQWDGRRASWIRRSSSITGKKGSFRLSRKC